VVAINGLAGGDAARRCARIAGGRPRRGGRGRSTTLLLRFAEGLRLDAPINAELFEAVLCYSRASGPERLLLASIAALSDEAGQLDGVTAGELRAAAGLARSTYRWARSALMTSSGGSRDGLGLGAIRLLSLL
jgi:hypothetical protein